MAVLVLFPPAHLLLQVVQAVLPQVAQAAHQDNSITVMILMVVTIFMKQAPLLQINLVGYLHKLIFVVQATNRVVVAVLAVKVQAVILLNTHAIVKTLQQALSLHVANALQVSVLNHHHLAVLHQAQE